MQLKRSMELYVEKQQLNHLEGIYQTAIPEVYFYRSSKGNQRQPFTYQSGLIILGQGHKNIHIGDEAVHYGEGDYLVVGMPMPLECEAFPDNEQPLLGISVNIPPQLLHRLVQQLEAKGFRPQKENQVTCGCLQSVAMDRAMHDCCIRLMNALCNEVETDILGNALVEELAYRALIGREGHLLFELAHSEGHYARIAKALNKVHLSFDEPLTVQQLAEEASMSVSAFHTAFRNVTLESPLQYIKKVRLNKAKELIHIEGKRVNEAARMVGYTSPSQFSREYKRHFNETPKGTVFA